MDGGIVEGLSIAADGTIAFAARTSDANLWATDVKPDGRGGEPVRLTDDVSRNTHADYSSDGRVAYMQTAIGSPAVGVADARGRQSARVPLLSGTGGADPQFDRTAAAAPDVADVECHRMGVRLGRSGLAPDDAGRPFSSRTCMSPRLSPDASAIAFHRIETDGAMTVWTRGFDGTAKQDRERSRGGVVSRPGRPTGSCSPSRSSAAMPRRSASCRATAAGRAVLTDARGQSWPHSWAPDNDRIAFAGQRDGVWNLYTVSRRTRVGHAAHASSRRLRLRPLSRLVARAARASSSSARSTPRTCGR